MRNPAMILMCGSTAVFAAVTACSSEPKSEITRLSSLNVTPTVVDADNGVIDFRGGVRSVAAFGSGGPQRPRVGKAVPPTVGREKITPEPSRLLVAAADDDLIDVAVVVMPPAPTSPIPVVDGAEPSNSLKNQKLLADRIAAIEDFMFRAFVPKRLLPALALRDEILSIDDATKTVSLLDDVSHSVQRGGTWQDDDSDEYRYAAYRKVGVIDSGIRVSAPMFAGRVGYSYDCSSGSCSFGGSVADCTTESLACDYGACVLPDGAGVVCLGGRWQDQSTCLL